MKNTKGFYTVELKIDQCYDHEWNNVKQASYSVFPNMDYAQIAEVAMNIAEIIRDTIDEEEEKLG